MKAWICDICEVVEKETDGEYPNPPRKVVVNYKEFNRIVDQFIQEVCASCAAALRDDIAKDIEDLKRERRGKRDEV